MALTKERNRWKFIRIPRILISKGILRLLGWTYSYDVSTDIKKAVMVVAPHTSNSDFVMGRLFYNALDIRVRFMIKKESFKFPLNFILKLTGGIPVNRKNPGGIVGEMVNLFGKYDELILGITPEGTRKPNPHWKKGFYRIALEAKIPMLLTYLDYKKKKGCVGKAFYPSGDFSKDMGEISQFYSGVTPKYPKNYVPPEY